MSEAHEYTPEPGDAEAAQTYAEQHAVTEAHPVELDDLGPGEPVGPPRDLRLLADIPVELTVELGRSKLAMRDVLGLVPGSVVELDRPADASVDVLVNGRVVARGEIVVVDGECGVRITEIVGRG